MINNKKIGVALGGGGARGLAHIGVLKAFKEAGIEIDLMVGVSMGAIIGSVYALGIDGDRLEKEALSFDKKKAARVFLDLGLPHKSILRGKKVHKYIESFIGKVDFSDTKIPFQIVATDLETGDEVILKTGSINNAIQASMCVPGIFPPVKIGDKYLVDGGVVNPTPIDVLEKMGADVIIGVDLVAKKNVQLSSPSLAAVLLQSYDIIRGKAIKSKLKDTNGNYLLIQPKLGGTIDSFKFYDINKFIQEGENATKKMLPEIREMIMR